MVCFKLFYNVSIKYCDEYRSVRVLFETPLYETDYNIAGSFISRYNDWYSWFKNEASRSADGDVTSGPILSCNDFHRSLCKPWVVCCQP